MPTISLAIQKGGSGKTTTAINLAAALEQMGRRVLLVDLDPQANLTQAFGLDKAQEAGNGDVQDKILDVYPLLKAEMSGKKVRLRAEQIPEVNRIRILPASLDLANAELELVSVFGREQLLKKLLQPLRSEFDFILIDCPPAIGMLTVNALVASDYVLMPLQAEFLPFKGLRSFKERYQQIKDNLNRKLKVIGIVLSRYDPRKTMHREIRAELDKRYPGLVFNTTIRTNIALAQAQAAGVDIFAYDLASNGAEDYQALSLELLERLAKDAK